MSDIVLTIGNRVTSSWSMRGWLAVAACTSAFETQVIDMYADGGREAVKAAGPAGLVPFLRDGDLLIWDTLAIIEYMNEGFPETRLWPEDRAMRAHARSISAEMHSGFGALRREMPMNLRRRNQPTEISTDCAKDIERIIDIWINCRMLYGSQPGVGPFLMGDFSAADIMFAPVVMRFWAYDTPMDETPSNYCLAVRNHPLVRQWLRDAAKETYPTAYDNMP